MSKFPPMSFGWIFKIFQSIWLFISFLFNKHIFRKVLQFQPVKYDLFPLTPVSLTRLSLVKRKILVLDLDESVRKKMKAKKII